jgi:ankyrin repeat protein
MIEIKKNIFIELQKSYPEDFSKFINDIKINENKNLYFLEDYEKFNYLDKTLIINLNYKLQQIGQKFIDFIENKPNIIKKPNKFGVRWIFNKDLFTNCDKIKVYSDFKIFISEYVEPNINNNIDYFVIFVHYLIKYNFINIADELIRKYNYIDFKFDDYILNDCTLLTDIIKCSKNIDVIKYLTDKININKLSFVKDDNNDSKNTETDLQYYTSSLHVAVRNNDHNCVRILLENNADVNILNSSEKTLIHEICDTYTLRSKEEFKESMIILNILFEFSINLNGMIYSTCLTYSIEKNMPINFIQELIDAGADINSKGLSPKAPLFAAIHYKNNSIDSLDLIKILCKNNIDINVKYLNKTIFEYIDDILYKDKIYDNIKEYLINYNMNKNFIIINNLLNL